MSEMVDSSLCRHCQLQVIRYSFNDGTNTQKEKVEECMHLWEPYVNLSFLKVPLDGDVRITFEQNGCWSYLAKACKDVAADKPTMGLGCVKETLHMTDPEKRFILHELGHMLGMIHEHQSPATNGVLTFKRQGWCGTKNPIYIC